MPFFYRLLERQQFIAGGIEYKQIYQAADFDSLVQEYGPNDGLTGGSKKLLKTPKWMVSKMQCPVEIDDDIEIMNANPSETQIVDLGQKYGMAAIQAIKIRAAQRLYGCATDTEKSERHTLCQGLGSALFPPTAAASAGSTYAGIARTTSAHLEWSAADYANTYTAYAINQYNLDVWLDSVATYNENPTDMLILMGPTLYNQLKLEFRTLGVYVGKAQIGKQGFESMEYNGVEIAKDPMLDRMTSTGLKGVAGTSNGYILHQASVTAEGASTSAGLLGDATYNGSAAYTGTSFVFVLDLNTWHVQYRKKTNSDGKEEAPFELGDFFDQSKVIGGKETKMARAKWKGNITCDAPNRNMVRANVA